MRIPAYIVTSDSWSRNTLIIWSDEQIEDIIPLDFINQRVEKSDEGITDDDALAELIDEFESDNDQVDEYWPNIMVCRSGRKYYRYNIDGEAEYIGDYDSLDEMIEENEDILEVQK